MAKETTRPPILSRRDLARLAAGLALAGATSDRVLAGEQPQAATGQMQDMPNGWVGSERVSLLIYPGMTAIDIIGPQYFMAALMGAEVRMYSPDGGPVPSDTGVRVMADGDLASMPDDPDILMVPGGTDGTLAIMRDPAVLDRIAAVGARAGIVASVCTGAMILGAAGLLEGRRATTHWAVHDLLPIFGARPENARWVIDGNRMSSAGVTAGMDLALQIVALRRDRLYAECTQLGAEYAPEPPFDAGTPTSAPPEAVAIMRSMYEDMRAGIAEVGKARSLRG